MHYDHQLSANSEVITDRLGHVTTYEYDDDGNILHKIQTVAGVQVDTAYTYDPNDNKLSELLPGHIKPSTFTYDALGDQLSQTDALGNQTKYAYNASRQVTTIDDANPAGPTHGTTTNRYDPATHNRIPRRRAGLDSFRCSRRALLTAPCGDPRLIAAVAEHRRLLAAAPLASPGADKRAVALALEQAILGGASSAVPQQDQAQAAAAAAAAQNVAQQGGKLRRIQLDIPPAGGGEPAAAPAAAAEARNAAKEGGKPLPRLKLDIQRMRLEAFLGGGL